MNIFNKIKDFFSGKHNRAYMRAQMNDAERKLLKDLATIAIHNMRKAKILLDQNKISEAREILNSI